MLRCKATTVDDEILEFLYPVRIGVSKSLDTPADELTAVFPLIERIPELKNISLYNEKYELLFYGIVDTQKFFYKTSGSFFSLNARNKVALLLDNEAEPQSYTLPSLEIIFKRHVEPYGFESFLGNKRSFAKEFVITKGMSEFEVLESFCVNYLGVYPKFLEDSTLDVTGNYKESSIVFSNELDDAIRYSSISEVFRRHKQYSEIYIKAGDDTRYSLNVKNEEAVNKGICRKRYINISSFEDTPISYGERLLKNSSKNSYEVVISSPGSINLNIGDIAKIKDSTLKSMDWSFLVYKLDYVLDGSKEITNVTLIRKEQEQLV